MTGITIVFSKEFQIGNDDFNNPLYSIVDMSVDNCLIAPIIEPSNAREQQAMQQSIDQVRIHLPKTFTGDVSNSDIVWNGKKFHVDSDSVIFMAENTPTQWNKYFRAEFVSNYSGDGGLLALLDDFITEDGNDFFISENGIYYFAQENLGNPDDDFITEDNTSYLIDENGVYYLAQEVVA